MKRAASAMRARIVLGVFAVAVLAAGSAAAEKKRVGVPRFDGPQEAVVRKAVMQVLKGDGYDVVGSRELDAAAKGAGASLDSNDGFRSVAKELSIAAFVTGEVSKKKAKLTVRNGSDGAVAGEGSFAGANPAKIAAEVRDGFARRLGSAVERGRAPSGAKKPAAPPVAEAVEGGDESGGGDEAPAAKPTARKTESAPPPSPSDESSESKAPTSEEGTEGVVAKKASPPPEEEGTAGPRAMDVEAGLRAFTRSLTYNQDIFNALRDYKLTLGPSIAVDAIIFPAGFATGGFASNIGGEVHLQQGFGVASNVSAGGAFPMGATFPTTIRDFWGGARVRFPMGGGSELSASVGAGEQVFKFSSGDGADRKMLDIPDTIYRYVRAGADLRFVVASGLTLGLGGAYRYVMNQGGQISDPGFFPFLSVMGMDLSAKIGYQVTPSVEARFTFDIRRYGFNMNSSPKRCDTDCDFTSAGMRINSIAGGAVDQTLGFGLAVAYVFGGVAPGAVEEEPAAEEAPKKKKKKKKKAVEEEESEGGGGEEGGDESDQ